MQLQALISLAGGEQNITRVLRPSGQLSLAVRDPALVGACATSVCLHQVIDEWHVTDSQPEADESELLTLGRAIEQQQRAALKPYLNATSSHYRPQWHIAPPHGLINDPNGFIYHNGQYHLFYQWSPIGCRHTDKYWVHLYSDEMVHWQWDEIALTPSDWFDSHGVYSGHALSVNADQLMLFYTGNTRLGEVRDRQTMQCAAVMDAAFNIQKLGPLIRDLPEGVTPHCRDPKVFRHSDQWWMVVGAQTSDLKGRLAVYRSDDLMDWSFVRLCGDELGDYGYMWECPDIFEIDGAPYVVFGPQGVDVSSELIQVPHQNRIAPLTWDEEQCFIIGKPVPLDMGFDFYAPQSLLSKEGSRVMCGWMGLPDEIQQPSCKDDWIHQLTLPREIYIEAGVLTQRPLEALTQLRGEQQTFVLADDGTYDLGTKSFELMTELEWGTRLRLFEDDQYFLEIYLDSMARRLLLDRTHTEITEGDTQREVFLDTDTVQLHLFGDASSLEIFINDGAAVMTTRVFTPATATRCSTNLGGEFPVVSTCSNPRALCRCIALVRRCQSARSLSTRSARTSTSTKQPARQWQAVDFQKYLKLFARLHLLNAKKDGSRASVADPISKPRHRCSELLGGQLCLMDQSICQHED